MKHIKVILWLRVENNSKFVRGRKRSIEEIERWVLSNYNMRKELEDDWEYELIISYENDEGLDNTIYDMIHEISRIADYHHCFIDYDVREKGSDRSW
jgi:hypothetical protein